MRKVVLFDLDGTLLPMDQDVFVKTYFKGLAQKLAPYGYQPEILVDAVWKGTAAMVKNDGSRTNEQAFWKCFAGIFGEQVLEHQYLLEEFYRDDFPKVQEVCGYNEKAAQTVCRCKELAYTVALATNPIFPAIATEQRIRWAGLSPEEFALYTTYENSCFCKPNPDYYRAILKQLGTNPEECLMVGNDVREDMIAKELGMEVFLLTDCIINKDDKDISEYPHGSFDDLMKLL